jgi:uncharacterized cysteine cluster protein YcgN (CxxCxxCC family)
MRTESDRSEWESLCRQCGLCCFTKYDEGDGKIFVSAIPCRYLDVVSRRCKIYPRRFEICPECIQLTEPLVREFTWLDEECGYVQALKKTEQDK